MAHKKDLSGETIGDFYVDGASTEPGQSGWAVTCSHNHAYTVTQRSLKAGYKKPCGCSSHLRKAKVVAVPVELPVPVSYEADFFNMKQSLKNLQDDHIVILAQLRAIVELLNKPVQAVQTVQTVQPVDQSRPVDRSRPVVPTAPAPTAPAPEELEPEPEPEPTPVKLKRTWAVYTAEADVNIAEALRLVNLPVADRTPEMYKEVEQRWNFECDYRNHPRNMLSDEDVRFERRERGRLVILTMQGWSRDCTGQLGRTD